MITKHYVDAAGNYLGGFQGAEPPAGAVEVASAPAHAADKFVNGAWVVSADRQKSALAAKRYEREIAGMIFDGFPVSTSLESRGRLLGAYNAAKEGRWADTDGWKFADGVFRPITAAQVQSLYLAVENYVKACFAVEAQKTALINAGQDPQLSEGWPA